jgi:hypothetical protein
MRKRIRGLVLAAIVACTIPGCSGGKDKGVNRDLDKPKAASEKEK